MPPELRRVSRPWRWLVAAACLAATTASMAAEQPLQAEVDDCVLRLAWASTAERAATLDDACPELLDELAESGWSSTLEGMPADSLTAAQLNQFVSLVRGWAAQPGVTLAPLAPVLAGLDQPDEAHRSLLDQVKAWFADLLPPGSGERLDQWLARLLPDFRLSPSTWSAIGNLLIALIIGGALWVLVVELARAGLFRRRITTAGTVVMPTPATDIALAPAGHLATARLMDRLTGFISQRFGRADAPSLSHREVDVLLPALVSLPEPVRDQLHGFTQASERIRYGAWQPDTEQAGQIITAGEEVLAAVRERAGENRTEPRGST